MIWSVALFFINEILYRLVPAHIIGAPPSLKQTVSIGIVVLLYLWLSLAVQRARDIGYSLVFAAGSFLGCFVALPIVATNFCSTFFGSEAVCSGGVLPKIGSLVFVLFFLILCSQPSNAVQQGQRQKEL